MYKILTLLFLSNLIYFSTIAQKTKSKIVDNSVTIDNEIKMMYPNLDTLYKYYHQNPELSLMEKNTSSHLANILRKLGYEVTEKIGGYGLVALLKNGEGKTMMVRADIDALPLEEKTGVPYSSKVITKDFQGNDFPAMHACGHDIHMTVFVGTAIFFSKNKHLWKGTLMLVGQPAEEKGMGAKMMLDDGLFEKFPLPNMVLGLHTSASLPAGKINYTKGYALASVDGLDITVYGMGGHGAYPHTTIDPIVMAAQMINQFQTIVSRKISPMEDAVVTVGSIHGGTKHNIISDQVKLQLTIRTYSESVRNTILENIERICKHVALSAGMPENKLPKIEIVENLPSTFNTPEFTEIVAAILKRELGNENVIESEAVMGGEDFSWFGKTAAKLPICIFWLGGVNPEMYQKSIAEKTQLPSLHSPFFAPLPEPTIKTGVKAMCETVLELMNN